jgi:hypothetical protein
MPSYRQDIPNTHLTSGSRNHRQLPPAAPRASQNHFLSRRFRPRRWRRGAGQPGLTGSGRAQPADLGGQRSLGAHRLTHAARSGASGSRAGCPGTPVFEMGVPPASHQRRRYHRCWAKGRLIASLIVWERPAVAAVSARLPSSLGHARSRLGSQPSWPVRLRSGIRGVLRLEHLAASGEVRGLFRAARINHDHGADHGRSKIMM